MAPALGPLSRRRLLAGQPDDSGHLPSGSAKGRQKTVSTYLTSALLGPLVGMSKQSLRVGSNISKAAGSPSKPSER